MLNLTSYITGIKGLHAGMYKCPINSTHINKIMHLTKAIGQIIKAQTCIIDYTQSALCLATLNTIPYTSYTVSMNLSWFNPDLS